MAQFLGDIAFLLALALVAAGLVLLHVGRERNAGLLRAAGWLLVAGAAATALCTGYFWLRYHRAGDFDRAGRAAAVEDMASAHESAFPRDARGFHRERNSAPSLSPLATPA